MSIENRVAWINGILATMNPEINTCEYGILKDKTLITAGGTIEAIVPYKSVEIEKCEKHIDLGGALVTPGFIDCHTHLIYDGNRASEWELRLNGVNYAEIANSGGGIYSTVLATRSASFERLYALSEKRINAMKSEGVTTLEIKSGYALEKQSERKILEVACALKAKQDMDIVPTLLAAHSVPYEYKDRADEYMDYVCKEMIPEFWRDGLFSAADIFLEFVAFSLEHAEKMFKTCADLGIPVKAHNEQLSNIGGSELLARYNGLSSDHIERIDERGVKALAKSGTVAVLLPGAFYFLKDTQSPPVSLLRYYHVPIALATDYNPGTSPFASIRLAMNMASTLFGLTPAEAMMGVTRNAARALGKEKTQGILKEGFDANFAVWNVDRPVEIFYEIGPNPLKFRVFKGIISE